MSASSPTEPTRRRVRRRRRTWKRLLRAVGPVVLLCALLLSASLLSMNALEVAPTTAPHPIELPPPTTVPALEIPRPELPAADGEEEAAPMPFSQTERRYWKTTPRQARARQYEKLEELLQEGQGLLLPDVAAGEWTPPPVPSLLNEAEPEWTIERGSTPEPIDEYRNIMPDTACDSLEEDLVDPAWYEDAGMICGWSHLYEFETSDGFSFRSFDGGGSTLIPTPEPNTALLVAGGLVAMVLGRRPA
ncbi:MAG: hypothetical protein MJE66_13725 [Proteobacteria bacterium]|nr:hypothetical protein [Pseudomonadota bacterium]